MVDGHIIGSFRGCSTVLRIDPDMAAGHKVVWRLGLTNLTDEQWDGLGKGPPPMEIIGDAEGQFCGQHGTALLPNGHLLMFDNGVKCMHDPWLDTQLLARPGGQYSRAVEYALDVDNGEAVFVRDHSLGGTRSKVGFKHGHVEELEGGDWLVGWGGWEPGTGAKPGESVTQVDPNTGEEKFSITLLLPNGASESMRPIALPPVALADVLAPLEARIVAGARTSTIHEGAADRPTVAVAFSRPVVDFAAETPSVALSGATVASVAPHIEAEAPVNSYLFTLTPAGAGDITVGLVADEPCADGGICTADGTVLSEVPASHVIRETALPNMWLSPTARDPVAAVKSAATYSVTFQGSWTTTVTSGGVPSGAHFTTLIGGVHNAGVTFLREGGMASAGVELMAELSGTSTLANEVEAAEPDALSVTQGSSGNIGPEGSSTINPVTLTTDHPRLTLLTMIAPSPDWFVGVSGLSLLDAQADWLASRTVNLYPWDAGTEDGTEFSLSNPETSPQETITSLRGMGKFSNQPIATLTFTRQSVNTAPSFTSDTSFEVDENQTAAATVVAEDPDSVDEVAYAITGGADALKFDIGETTMSPAPIPSTTRETTSTS